MTTSEHKLKLTADDADIKKVRGAIKTAFTPLTVREFRRETEQLGRTMRELTARQLDLTKAMMGASKGSEEYKKFKDQLKEVGKEARTVETALGGLKRSYQDLAQTRRQSFIGGMAAGAGVAQFLPAGPGAYPRLAGAMMGGALRRGAGAGAAPFMAPGMGGLSTLLGAIPGVGGAAQGALQAGQGMYQQAVAFSQAQLQNVRYISGGARAGLAYQGAATPAAARAALADAQREAAAEKTRLQQRAGGATTAVIEPGKGGLDPLGPAKIMVRGVVAGAGTMVGRYLEGFKQKFMGDLSPEARKIFSREWDKGISETAKTATGFDSKTIRAAAPKLAVAGYDAGTAQIKSETAEDRVRNAKALAARALVMARRKAFREAAGEEYVPLPGAGFGVQFGLTGAQTQAALGEYMGARGGAFTRGARGAFAESLAARTAFGVSGAQAGAYARMGMAGGGGVGGQMGLAAVLETAVEMGLKGSRTVEMLQEMVTLGQQAEKTGVKFNAEHFLRTTGMLKVGGLAAPQAQRIAGGLGRKAMDVSARGVQTPGDLALLRAFGFDPKGGRLSYVRAIAAAEGGMTPEALGNIMGMVQTSFQGPEEIQAFHLRRFLSRGLGTPIGVGDATKLLRSQLAGSSNEQLMAQVEGMVQRGQAAGAGLVPGAKGLVRAGGGGLAVGAASLQARAVGIGGRMAGTFQNLERIGQNSVKVLSNFNGGIQSVVDTMAKAVKEMDKLTSEGIGEYVKKLMGGDEKGGKPPKTGKRK